MILYNTLMGVCAGVIMLLAADLLRRTSRGETLALGGYGPALLVLGVPLTVLAGAMTLTWPLTVNPPVNIVFGEPSLLLALLAVVGGGVLTRVVFLARDNTLEVTDALTRPARWVVCAVGLVLLSCASAILSYDLIGDAPPQEPITGQFTGWEDTFFGLTYLVAAVGCLATPWASVVRSTRITRFVWVTWALSGAAFLLFSVLNYRTHIGLLVNLERGTNYRW
jgi:Protein of unknown function (DUF981)